MPAPHPQVRAAAVTAEDWSYRHSGRSRNAVTGLQLRIEPGERVLLLGASGAGKSTLLHGLAGVLGEDDGAEDGHAEYGRLLIDGVPAADLRGRAGLLQQDPDTQVVLSRVGDDVAFGAENLAVPREQIWARVYQALADVGLELPLDHPTSALSGGQKQRLGLAGILAMAPGLLLLDEPTANLDPPGVLGVRDAVTRALDATGATLVVVEHRVAVWAQVVDRIVVLAAGGGVLLDGPPGQVLDAGRAALQQAGVWVPGYRPAIRTRTRGPILTRIGHQQGTFASDSFSLGSFPPDLPGSFASDPSGARPPAGDLLLSSAALGVSRQRARRRRPVVPVASDISVRVRAGEALSVTGPNGVGKSTFALTLAGLLPPVQGEVTAAAPLSRGAGPSPYGWSSRQLISRIGTVFQEPEHQFVTTRVRDELSFGPRRLAGERGSEAAALDKRLEELLERLRLTDLADANPFTLSGGEKRRLSVATVLAAGPDVLVLDEPTFGQDANTWAELANLLVELLEEGTAVVSVTHDEDFTEVLGGARLHLEAGTALADGRPPGRPGTAPSTTGDRR